MIKRMWLWLGVLSSIFTSAAFANEFTAEKCSDLRSDRPFSVSFSISAAQLEETVWADKGVGGGNQEPIALWTDDPSVGFDDDGSPDGTIVSIRAGSEIVENESYNILLTFDESANSDNKKGLLEYYLLRGAEWVEVDSTIADFTSLNSVNIALEGESVEELECSDGVVIPVPPEYSENAQFEFGVADCSSGSCVINFNQTYQFTPLVFVMPTISISEPDRDHPATLAVTSIDKSSAQIEYRSVEVSSSNRDAVMNEVSYLVIEPGIADMGGHRVVAGYVDTDQYRSKNGSLGSTSVSFSQFGSTSDFSVNPVVLHQLQSDNNAKWMTSGKDRDSTASKGAVSLFLELSASRDRNHNYINERVAFVVTEPVSNLEVGNYLVEFGRGTKTINQSHPNSMQMGCERSFVPTELSRIDGIIGKKQERNGGHGGWFRRCDLDENARASFVLDEDYFNRGHWPEEVGHFAFEEVAPLDFDICRYFPEPAQSWNISPSGPYAAYGDSVLDVTNGNSARINGWSDAYVQNNLINKSTDWGNQDLLKVGFDQASDIWQVYTNPVCEVGGCEIGNDDGNIALRKILEPEIVELNPGSQSLSITGDNYNSICTSNPSLCRLTQSGNTANIEILSSLNSLELSLYGGAQNYVVTFSDGIHIGSMRVGGSRNVETRYASGSTVTFGTVFYSDGSLSLYFEDNARINVKDSWLTNNFPITSEVGDITTLLYGPEASFTFQSSNVEFYGYILGKSVAFENPITIHGSVTAHTLTMKQNAVIQRPDNAVCGTPPVDDFRIELTPVSDIALICEDIELTATVYNGDSVYTNFNGQVTFSGDDFSGSATANNGVATIDLSSDGASKTVSSVTAQASIQGSSYTSNTSGDYKFVPFRFDVPDQYVVAGLPKHDIGTRPLACDSSDKPTFIQYVGTPVPTWQLVKPSTVAPPIVVEDSWLTYNYDSAGNAEYPREDSLSYYEAGSILVTLTDSNFNCEGHPDCPIDGGAELTGSFMVYSRPWTFALCDASSKLESGTAGGGNGFVAAGEYFDLNVRPIRWQSGGVIGGDPIDTSAYCSDDVTTHLFMQSNAEPSQVELTSQLHTPSTGTSTRVLESDTELVKSHDGLHFQQLFWTDVGSLTVKASAQAPYLVDRNDMVIDEGYRNIGRFYPAYFVLEKSDWIAPDKQGGVAYLGQPYDMLDLEVYAYSAKGDEKVTNYDKFSASLQATFPKLQDDDYADRIAGYEGDALWEESALGSVWKPRLTDVVFERKEISSTPVVTSPDGPFNVSGGADTKLELVIAGADPVSFSQTESSSSTLLIDQPPARYGRMALADVSGSTSGSIRVPLRVEYFDGSSFVVNDDDDASGFDHNKHCTLDGITTNASFSFDGIDRSVSSGTNNNLLASRSGTNTDRETVRLFLRQGGFGDNPSDVNCQGQNFTQPWLQYNWRDKGDEDPSTLVTFGVYRGNDRIIFRGEPGLTGQ